MDILPFVVGGIGAGIYALSTRKNEPMPPPVELLIAAAVPVVNQQIAHGVPSATAINAAVVAVQATQLDQVVKANICVLYYDSTKASKSKPYLVPDSLVNDLRKLGWQQYEKVGFPLVPIPLIGGGVPIMTSKFYLCPSGKTPEK